MVKSGESFRYAFIVVTLLGFICCLYRSDFNVAVGIFGFMLWNESHFPQKHRVLWVLFLSILGDLAWVLGVSVLVWQKEPIANDNLRVLTQVASIVNMVYKLILIIFAMCTYEQCSDLFKLSAFRTKMLYL